MGFFFIVGVVQFKRFWRRRAHLTDSELCGVVMLLTTVVMCSFVRSSVISSNDFGWRGFMFAQFILLIWGAELMSDGLFYGHRRLLRREHPKRMLVAVVL